LKAGIEAYRPRQDHLGAFQDCAHRRCHLPRTIRRLQFLSNAHEKKIAQCVTQPVERRGHCRLGKANLARRANGRALCQQRVEDLEQVEIEAI
jgi:hypothetical protein